MGQVSFFSTATESGRVWLLGAAFGLGPLVAAETLTRQLGWKLLPWLPDQLPAGAAPPDLLLNFGVVGQAARQPAAARVWVDCLMWLRQMLPPAVSGYDAILAEGFFPTCDHLRSAGPRVIDVEPLYGPLPQARPRNAAGPVLVSFGGVRTPHSTEIHCLHFQARILDALAEAVQRQPAARQIVCSGPAQFVSALAERRGLRGITFINPERPCFLALLGGASLYVVQPGLYGPFEAFATGTPTVFAPPFSYTQLGQALRYREQGLLGPTPLVDELSAAVGPLRFVFGEEQARCFERLAAWFLERGGDAEVDRQLARWAHTLEGEVPAELTAARRRLIDDSRRYPAAAEVIADRWGQAP